MESVYNETEKKLFTKLFNEMMNIAYPECRAVDSKCDKCTYKNLCNELALILLREN